MWNDGEGRTGNEIEFAATRPDLPPCERCNSGEKCSCQVYRTEDDEPIACACIGFISCPECPRERSGILFFG